MCIRDRDCPCEIRVSFVRRISLGLHQNKTIRYNEKQNLLVCLLYTSGVVGIDDGVGALQLSELVKVRVFTAGVGKGGQLYQFRHGHNAVTCLSLIHI